MGPHAQAAVGGPLEELAVDASLPAASWDEWLR